MEDKIIKMLLMLGIDPKLLGFQALKHAVMLACKNSNMLKAVTKELYPSVAKQMGNNVTWRQVERSTRYAIEAAFDQRDADGTISRLLKLPTDAKSGKYTNSTFIALCVQWVKREVLT